MVYFKDHMFNLISSKILQFCILYGDYMLFGTMAIPFEPLSLNNLKLLTSWHKDWTINMYNFEILF